ncbi:MAG: carbohydrate kinase family protein [Candidatus Latescibacteria bacterium]|nr:carbohydrate kinase family protein [Candidatus Latescibacterota bacterium]
MTIHVDRGKTVFGIGSNVIDVIYRVNQIAGPEEKVFILPNDQGKVVKEMTGGVTLNHLAWARLLGVPTGLFGFQGDDHYGMMIRETMDRHGIDRSTVLVQVGASSAFSVIYVAPDAERAIYMSPGPTAVTTPDDIQHHFAETIRQAAIVTTEVSQLPLPTVVAVLRTAADAGVPAILDVDIPPDFATGAAHLGTKGDFEEAVRLAVVVKPSKAAADQMVRGGTVEEQAVEVVAEYGASLVAITDGRRGSVFSDGQGAVRLPVHSITPRDSTGAGDAFLGGMVAGLYYDLSVEDTGRLANACGAACCLIDGAFPQLDRSLDDVRGMYDGPKVGTLGR